MIAFHHAKKSIHHKIIKHLQITVSLWSVADLTYQTYLITKLSEEIIMRRGTFFFIQAIVSLVITSLIWYMEVGFLEVAMNDINAHGIVVTDATKSPFLVFAGCVAVYLILTIVYIIIGARKVENWHPSAIIVSILICIFMLIFGLFVPGIISSVGEQLNTIPETIHNIVDSWGR